MMTNRKGWKCWIMRDQVLIENGAGCLTMTIAEARKLRDLLDEMVPEKDPKPRCIHCGAPWGVCPLEVGHRNCTKS